MDGKNTFAFRFLLAVTSRTIGQSSVENSSAIEIRRWNTLRHGALCQSFGRLKLRFVVWLTSLSVRLVVDQRKRAEPVLQMLSFPR